MHSYTLFTISYLSDITSLSGDGLVPLISSSNRRIWWRKSSMYSRTPIHTDLGVTRKKNGLTLYHLSCPAAFSLSVFDLNRLRRIKPRWVLYKRPSQKFGRRKINEVDHTYNSTVLDKNGTYYYCRKPPWEQANMPRKEMKKESYWYLTLQRCSRHTEW